MFSKKATKIDEIFTVDLTLFTMCRIDSEDFVNFCGLLRKLELYLAVAFLSTYGLMFQPSISKGQLISKCPLGVFKSPKIPTNLFP